MPLKQKHPLYHVWRSMIERCRNPRFKQWEDYGGRGIRVCEQWSASFSQFCDDLGPRPLGYVLDRINNDLGYFPGNCRWVDRTTSQRNQRVTRKIVINGAEYIAADLADLAHKKTDTIVERASKGFSLDEILSTKRNVFYEGLRLGGKANGARQQSKTHCPKGHEYTEANTYISKQGWRRCRACRRI